MTIQRFQTICTNVGSAAAVLCLLGIFGVGAGILHTMNAAMRSRTNMNDAASKAMLHVQHKIIKSVQRIADDLESDINRKSADRWTRTDAMAERARVNAEIGAANDKSKTGMKP